MTGGGVIEEIIPQLIGLLKKIPYISSIKEDHLPHFSLINEGDIMLQNQKYRQAYKLTPSFILCTSFWC